MLDSKSTQSSQRLQPPKTSLSCLKSLCFVYMFMFCNFMPCNFDDPSFSCSSFSAL